MSIICPLFSSSCGNSIFVGTEKASILVDAGASMKGIISSLANIDEKKENIKAILVTHEHFDHIKGLKTLLKNTDTALVGSLKTIEALASQDIIAPQTRVIAVDDYDFEINGIVVKRFETSHDCEGSSGFSLTLPDNKKVCVCTDLGVVTNTVRDAIKGSDLILMESNHDIDMLKKGPYPPKLKARILSEKGHISNAACSAELKELLNSGTKRFILGHLSQKNNTPLLAKSTAEAALMDLGAQNNKDYILSVAKPANNGVSVI